MSANPHNLRDGELLPVVGGPYDGAARAVSVVFPFLEGGCPSSLLQLGRYWYRLDGRRWVYAGLDGVDVKRGEARR